MFNEFPAKFPSILVVDDQPANIRVLVEAVRDLGEVRFAVNGIEALKIARTYKPDVVLLDIEMPDMDGFSVCRALKSDPDMHDMAVIFVTAHGADVNELHARGLGGVEFLEKPLNISIARARIQTQLTLQLKAKQLEQARHNLEEIVHNLPAFIACWDQEMKCVFSNDTNANWFAINAHKMQGMHIKEVIGLANYISIEQYFELARNEKNASFDITLVQHDGQIIFGQASLVFRDHAYGDQGFLMLITDITARKLVEEALFNEKESIRITLNSIGDAVIATDVDGKVTFLNPIAETMTGWLLNESIGLPIEYVMPLRDSHDGHVHQNPIRIALREKRTVGMAMNCALQRRDGRLFDVEDSASPITNHQGQIRGAIIVFHDVSEARALMIKMTHLANHDALTNLPNRMLLQDRCEQAIQLAKRSKCHVALLMLDLDNFKLVNDAMGYEIGDFLLQQIATRLKKLVRASDTICRQGGDEFVILLPELEGLDEVSVLAQRIKHIVSEPYDISGNRFDLSVSIGISLFPDDSLDAESLYRHADAAMYRAKQDGRNRYCFFSSDIEDALRARHLLDRYLREALDNGGFEVFYQPKIDARKNIIVGAEALVRWRKDGEIIPPSQFIPIAEETGLIVALGHYVLKQACLENKKWHDRGHFINIAVNVSVVQIAEKNFVESVQAVIDETGISARFLELEITESVLAKNFEQAHETIVKLKSLGVKIAIDDFGTGYSSLAYLKKFPIDVLKIDQSFVRDMLNNRSDAAIITAVVSMARDLGLCLVAEGVETKEQSQALLLLGCEVMQGYFYAKPMPKDDVISYFEDVDLTVK